jgi:hydroxymethylpyrimidine pyrophosphatase-like HAD family hydrolase
MVLGSKLRNILIALLLLIQVFEVVGRDASYFVLHDPHVFYDTSDKRSTTSVSIEALVLLDEISLKSSIICASSMNVDLMQQTHRHFPMINWWILEDGGKIFSRKRDENGNNIISEDDSYKTHMNKAIHKNAYAELLKFQNELISEGYTIESEGYDSMFRVLPAMPSAKQVENIEIATSVLHDQCKDQECNHKDNIDMHSSDEDTAEASSTVSVATEELLRAIEARTPSQLTTTYSKGSLIVQFRGIGKQMSIEWLTKKLANEHGNTPEYIFMGDDENDLKVAEKAVHTFILSHASTKMQAWFDSNKSDKVTKASGDGFVGNSHLLQSVLEFLM